MLSGVRFAISGALLLLGLCAARRGPTNVKITIARAAFGGVALALSNTLTCMGFISVQSGQGALLLATTALWMTLIDSLWPNSPRRVGAAAWAGLVLGILGVSLLIDFRASARSSLVGSFILLASSLFWAFTSVWQSRHPSHTPPLLEAAFQMIVAAAVLLPATLVFGERWPRQLPASAWGSFWFLVLTGSLIGFVSFLYILRHLPPNIVGLYTYVNPVVAAWAGWWWLDEKVGSRLFLASILVLGSVAVVRLADRRKAASSVATSAADASFTPVEPLR